MSNKTLKSLLIISTMIIAILVGLLISETINMSDMKKAQHTNISSTKATAVIQPADVSEYGYTEDGCLILICNRTNKEFVKKLTIKDTLYMPVEQ